MHRDEELFTYTREDAYNMASDYCNLCRSNNSWLLFLLWTLILCTLIQEYVFEGEDGHTEIMPVSHLTWCSLMCNLFLASFVFLVLIIFFIAFWIVFLQHRYGLLPLPHRTTTTFTLTPWWCWCTTPHPFQSPNCLLSTSAKSTSDWKWILRVKQDFSLI